MALPKKLKDLNLFSNGESWQGIVQSITLPTLTRKIEEWRGGGMDGAVGIDMGQDGLLTVQWTVGGLATRIWTSAAPAARTISTILTEVVPRTMLSSIRTMRLPRTSSRLALCLRLTPAWRAPSLGWMKVRPT